MLLALKSFLGSSWWVHVIVGLLGGEGGSYWGKTVLAMDTAVIMSSTASSPSSSWQVLRLSMGAFFRGNICLQAKAVINLRKCYL